jgi:hypothetical protein
MKCPICSTINNNEILKTLPHDFQQQFSPNKKIKGIVSYSERTAELILEPTLVFHSPFSSNKKQTITEIENVELTHDNNNVNKEIADKINNHKNSFIDRLNEECEDIHINNLENNNKNKIQKKGKRKYNKYIK